MLCVQDPSLEDVSPLVQCKTGGDATCFYTSAAPNGCAERIAKSVISDAGHGHVSEVCVRDDSSSATLRYSVNTCQLYAESVKLPRIAYNSIPRMQHSFE